jgi:hypothetical protein
MERIGGRRPKAEMFVEASCLLIFGMHHHCADAGNGGCRQGAANGIFEQANATARRASSITGIGWIASPLWIRSGACSAFTPPTTSPLVYQGEPQQKTIQGFFAAIKTV